MFEAYYLSELYWKNIQYGTTLTTTTVALPNYMCPFRNITRLFQRKMTVTTSPGRKRLRKPLNFSHLCREESPTVDRALLKNKKILICVFAQ